MGVYTTLKRKCYAFDDIYRHITRSSVYVYELQACLTYI